MIQKEEPSSFPLILFVSMSETSDVPENLYKSRSWLLHIFGSYEEIKQHLFSVIESVKGLSTYLLGCTACIGRASDSFLSSSIVV